MIETSVFEFWWLIPLFLILLCIFGGHGCCASWRRRGEPRANRTSAERDRYGHHDTALAILNRRYALGEIDDEEYTRKRAALCEAGKGARG